jgi:hypothetical protein
MLMIEVAIQPTVKIREGGESQKARRPEALEIIMVANSSTFIRIGARFGNLCLKEDWINTKQSLKNNSRQFVYECFRSV